MGSSGFRLLLMLYLLGASYCAYEIYLRSFESVLVLEYQFDPFRVKYYLMSALLLVTLIITYKLLYFYTRALYNEQNKSKGKKKAVAKRKAVEEDDQSWGDVINEAKQRKKEF